MVYEIERSLDFDVNKKLELYRKKNLTSAMTANKLSILNSFLLVQT